MSVLKYDHERRPDFQLERADVRSHYENVTAFGLLSIRRRWRLIASLVALALLLACSIMPLLPRQYTASALVYPNLFDRQGKVAPLAALDAGSVVNSEARLIVSDAILHPVVRRLGLDSNPEAARSRSWVSDGLDRFRTLFLPETRNDSPFDRQVAVLRSKLEVVKDTRSYLISISFTARSADEAAQVANAIALEYLQDKTTQRVRNDAAEAEAELERQLAMYGEKHPKVRQA